MNAPPSATRALRPHALAEGARVALVAPAGPLDTQRIAASEERCRSLGLEPIVFPSARRRERYLAGTDAERLADLQGAFDDPDIDAVWALRGGYGTLRILDRLSLERQRRDPVPFIGFSDNSTVHLRHAALGVVSFHGPHPAGELAPEADAWFRRVLFRPEPPGPLPRVSAGPEPCCLAPGVVEGPLVGGNLAILASMCGGPHALRARGSIVFLEDVGEPAYKVDRMLLQLERSGALEGVVGLALGRFTADGEGADGTADILCALQDVADRLRVPVVAGLPFGHVAENLVLPLGVRARLDAASAELTLLEPAVRSS